MPLYEYQCDACGHRFEVIQKFSDAPIAECRACGAPVRKLLSSPAIQFKGSGWYITDYAKKGGSGTSAGNASSGEARSGKADGEAKSSSSSSDSGGSSTTSTPSSSGTDKKAAS